jgi:hypothetical protein
MTLAGLSERAAAGSRKCCPVKDPGKKTLSGIISEIGKKYKANQAGSGCSIMPEMCLVSGSTAVAVACPSSLTNEGDALA